MGQSVLSLGFLLRNEVYIVEMPFLMAVEHAYSRTLRLECVEKGQSIVVSCWHLEFLRHLDAQHLPCP